MICRFCKKQSRPGKKACAECGKKKSNGSIKSQRKKVENGNCASCGKEREKINSYRCNKCNEIKNKNGKLQRKKLIKEVLLYYSFGNKIKCVCCGENNLMFMTLDHINNDGSIERKGKQIDTTQTYRKLRRGNYPVGYQTLCYNCNCGKARNGGICPHKTRKDK